MKRIWVCLSFVFVARLVAEEKTFHFPPPEYETTCKQHLKLVESGNAKKAKAIAQKYRQTYFEPYFQVKPKEVLRLRLINDYGWWPSANFLLHTLSLYQMNGKISEDPPMMANTQPFFNIYGQVRNKDVKSFEQSFQKYFPGISEENFQTYPYQINEVVILIDSTFSRLAVSDCFTTLENSLGLAIESEAQFRVYTIAHKVIPRQKKTPAEPNVEKTNKQGGEGKKSSIQKTPEGKTSLSNLDSALFESILSNPENVDAFLAALKSGADIHAQVDSQSSTGKAKGWVEAFKKGCSLEENGNWRLPSQMSILQLAICMKRVNIVGIILKKRLSFKQEHEAGYGPYVPLEINLAAEIDSAAIVELLLVAGIEPNSTFACDYETCPTPMRSAIKNGNINIVKMLLKYGWSPNDTGHGGGCLPLDIAYQAKQKEIIKLLRSAGANRGSCAGSED